MRGMQAPSRMGRNGGFVIHDRAATLLTEVRTLGGVAEEEQRGGMRRPPRSAWRPAAQGVAVSCLLSIGPP